MISNFLSIFKKEMKTTSAGLAKERLQIIIASNNRDSDFSFMPELEAEMLKLVRKYIKIEDSAIDMKVEVDDDTGCKMLELNVSLENGKQLNIKG